MSDIIDLYFSLPEGTRYVIRLLVSAGTILFLLSTPLGKRILEALFVFIRAITLAALHTVSEIINYIWRILRKMFSGDD